MAGAGAPLPARLVTLNRSTRHRAVLLVVDQALLGASLRMDSEAVLADTG